jgi:PAS domain S-box-containing protein
VRPRCQSTAIDLPATDLDAALERMVQQSVRPTATALAGTFVVFLVFNLLDLPRHAVAPVVICDVVLVLAFLTVRALAGRGAIPSRRAHAVLVGMAGLVVANILLTFYLLREPFYTTYVLITVIGGGFLLLSARWLVAATAGIVLAWMPVAWLSSSPKQFMHYGFTLFAASVVAALVHIIRIRTVRRLETLRLLSERRKLQLEQALASAEHQLSERERAEARYRDLVQGIEAIVWEADTEWRFTFVSDHAVEVLWFPAAQWLQVPNFWLSRVHPDDREQAAAFCQRWRDGVPGPDEIECRGIRQDGATVWTRLVVSVADRAEGGPRQLRGLIFDITRHKQQEEMRRSLEEQLQQAQKMEAIGTLAGGVAHDINNILGAIMGLASLLKEQLPGDDPCQPDLDSILSACERGHDLTRNLLGFARRGKVQTVRVSLNRAVEEVAELLGRTISRRISVSTHLAPDLAEIEGDPGQMNHVLLNLALNAVDAMQGKGVLTFTTRNAVLDETQLGSTPHLKPGAYVSVTVGDTGVGMDTETLEHAFEPFFTTKEPGHGTGLGLSMVYGTANNHGGRVFIESVLDRGTRVTLQLPAAAPAPHAATGSPSRPAPGRRRTPATILVVDDEALIRTTARRMLHQLGHSVVLARDGREAVSIFEERRQEIDLVLLDLVMPEMDGLECFERLRVTDPDVRVIFSSGYAHPPSAGEGLPTGDRLGFLKKPYDLDELAVALARRLERRDPPGAEITPR